MSLTQQIEQIVQEEVDQRVEDIQNELANTKRKLTIVKKRLHDYEEANKELIKSGKEFEQMKVLKSLVNNENIESFLEVLNLLESNIALSGMNSRDTPQWFRLLIKFYPDRVRLLEIFDFFNIEYKESLAKNFKMPFDYNEEELIYVIKNFDKISIPNGCYFEGNIGFFYDSIRSTNTGSPKEILSSHWSHTIPYQHLFCNKLFKEEKIFNLFLEKMKSGRIYDREKIFSLPAFVKLSNEQIFEIAQLLPNVKGMNTTHKEFLKKHPFLFKENPHWAEMFKSEMIAGGYNTTFHYQNFPLLMQIDFIKKSFGIGNQIEEFNKLDIPVEEKKKLINEVLNRYIR